MVTRRNIEAELDRLREDLESLRRKTEKGGEEAAPGASEAQHVKRDASVGPELSGHASHLAELVRTLLDEAEEGMTHHPVATVAGALALGIVIGRLSAR